MYEQKWWIHADGWIYTGDKIEGAREATKEEVEDHLNSVNTDSDS